MNTKFTNIDNKDATQDSAISNLQTTVADNTSDINDLQTTTSEHTESIGDLEVTTADLLGRMVDVETEKLDATKCTYQTTAPTAAITDGGVHVVVLDSEPTTKYDGYIYFIDDAQPETILPSFVGMIITGDDHISTEAKVKAIYGETTS